MELEKKMGEARQTCASLIKTLLAGYINEAARIYAIDFQENEEALPSSACLRFERECGGEDECCFWLRQVELYDETGDPINADFEVETGERDEKFDALLLCLIEENFELGELKTLVGGEEFPL